MNEDRDIDITTPTTKNEEQGLHPLTTPYSFEAPQKSKQKRAPLLRAGFAGSRARQDENRPNENSPASKTDASSDSSSD